MTSRSIIVLTLGLCEFCHSFSFHCHAIKSKKWKPFNSESPQSWKRKKINLQKKLRQKWGLCDITYTRYSGNFLRKFTKLCMETPSWCPFKGHKYDGRKPRKSICLWVFLSNSEYITWGIHKDESNIHSETRNVQIAKSQKIGNVFSTHKSFLGRQLNSVSRKS